MATAEGARASAMTQMVTKELLVALKYTPDDKLDWVPMGAAKTPKAIIVECATGNKWMAAELRCEENAAGVWEGIKVEDYPTREALAEFVEASQAELLAAIDALTEEQLDQKRKVFWGEESLRDLVWLGMMHTNYHVGQLNYIQTLWGDTEMHHA
ncbi:MAG: DinB family protein [Armatimonadetes bacterium]|nr:DinB family protein [Armatimonadota bacterium]